MRVTILFAVVALTGWAMAGCDESTMNPSAPTTTGTPSTGPATTGPAAGTTGSPSTSPSTGSYGTDDRTGAATDTTGATAPPDNTAKNKRDASGDTKTPIDQDEDSGDLKITQNIRSRITDEKNMSINARNVKIVTSQGKVTLRGPVENAKEKEAIENIARDVAGETNVTSEIEVVNR